MTTIVSPHLIPLAATGVLLACIVLLILFGPRKWK